MNNDWIVVFSTSDDFNAEIARGVLDEHEIENVVINKKDAAYHFGEIEIFVKREFYITAKYLLKEFEN